jgi:hypothetical protein
VPALGGWISCEFPVPSTARLHGSAYPAIRSISARHRTQHGADRPAMQRVSCRPGVAVRVTGDLAEHPVTASGVGHADRRRRLDCDRSEKGNGASTTSPAEGATTPHPPPASTSPLLDNHLHVRGRLDPQVAAARTDEEVVRRWARHFPPRDGTMTGTETRTRPVSSPQTVVRRLFVMAPFLCPRTAPPRSRPFLRGKSARVINQAEIAAQRKPVEHAFARRQQRHQEGIVDLSFIPRRDRLGLHR